MLLKIKEATEYLRDIIGEEPVAGVVLGSGLGNFGQQIKVEKEISYSDIPHFPVSTVEGNGVAEIKTVAGGKLMASMDGKKILIKDESGNKAYVTIADVNQSNGVIHVIDHVLLPKM